MSILAEAVTVRNPRTATAPICTLNISGLGKCGTRDRGVTRRRMLVRRALRISGGNRLRIMYEYGIGRPRGRFPLGCQRDSRLMSVESGSSRVFVRGGSAAPELVAAVRVIRLAR